MNFREKLRNIIEEKEESYIFDCNLYDYIQEELIPNKSDIPTLFRYTPADYNNIRSLETKQLFLSEIGSMKDIFEGLSCEIDDRVIENLEKLHDIAYFKSFSDNNNHLLMWSSYADNYSGMCVEYDLTNMQDKCYYHLFPVVYSEKRHAKANLQFTFDELIGIKRACPPFV